MLKLSNVTKKYGKIIVISDVNYVYEEGKIYGLIGYNGSGKTTLLKLIAGIYRPDGGDILVDDKSTLENEEFKRNSFLMTEELFFRPQSTPSEMRDLYQGYYSSWNDDLYAKLLNLFGLCNDDKIAGFSKGMQRQTGLLLALATMPKYLFLDETFDGLDIAKRKLLAEILKKYVSKQQAIVIVTSHYLNELEGITDSVGMIDNHSFMVAKTEGTSLEEYFLCKKEAVSYEIDDLFK